jgi:hypothetical protein
MSAEDDLLKRADKAAADTGDPTVVTHVASQLEAGRTFAGVTVEEEDLLSDIRKAWSDRARAVADILKNLDAGYQSRRSELLKIREDVARRIASPSASGAPIADGPAVDKAFTFLDRVNAGGGKVDVVEAFQQVTALAAENQRVLAGAGAAFSRRNLDAIDRLLDLLALQYRKPGGRLKRSLRTMRVIRFLSGLVRPAITVLFYLVVFTIGRYADPGSRNSSSS